MAEKQTIKQTIENTDSIVHETFKDLSDIGEIIDGSQDTLRSVSKRINKIISQRVQLEEEMKRTISHEVENQIKPLGAKLDAFLLTKPKVIYIRLKFPNPFRGLINKIHGFTRK